MTRTHPSPELQAAIERHRAYWVRGETDGPLLDIKPHEEWGSLEIPTKAGVDLPPDGYLEDPGVLDPEQHYRNVMRDWGDGGPLDGDVFRVLTPYFPVPWIEAMCGCGVQYFEASGAMTSRPLPGGWDQALKVRVEPDNPWLRKLLEFYTVLAELSGGCYAMGVVQPMRGPIDLMGALVGASEACTALAERPELAHELLRVVTDVWIQVVSAQISAIPTFEGGYGSNQWYGLWVPGTNATTQNDLASLISPRMYAEFLAPCDRRICDSLEYPIIHLHSNCMHVLDPVLDVEGFSAIQIGADPGEQDPTLEELIPSFVKVQERDVGLIIQCSRANRAELDSLIDALSPEGLIVWARVADE